MLLGPISNVGPRHRSLLASLPYLVRSRFLEIGVDRIVDQVVDRNIYSTYMPQIQLLVKEMLDIKDDAEGMPSVRFQC